VSDGGFSWRSPAELGLGSSQKLHLEKTQPSPLRGRLSRVDHAGKGLAGGDLHLAL